MDHETIQRYDDSAAKYVAEWMRQTPVVIRQLVLKWFSSGSGVLDIGSGSGRDVRWLMEQGFKAEGVDASSGLLTAAREANPMAVFRQDALPMLENINDRSVDNILCAAVLMHLPGTEIALAAENLLRVTREGGRLICSVRPSRECEPRESDGRLYTQISLKELGRLFGDQGAIVLETVSSGHERAGTSWHTVVIEKPC